MSMSLNGFDVLVDFECAQITTSAPRPAITPRPSSVVVDSGEWTETEWTSCNAYCGETGTRYRKVSGSLESESCSSELCWCPFGEDSPIECKTQGYIALAAFLLGCCCCYSCCIWCCCKMRRVKRGNVVVRRLEGGQRNEAKMRAKFEIIDDPEQKVLTTLSNRSPDEEQALGEFATVDGSKNKLVRWSYDEKLVDKWLGSGAKPGDAEHAAGQVPGNASPNGDERPPDCAQPDGAQPDGAQPEGAQPGGAQPGRDTDSGVGEAGGDTSREKGIKINAVDLAEVHLAYLMGVQVEYFSSTLLTWIAGHIGGAEPLARTLQSNTANNSSNNKNGLVPDYNLRLCNSQMRYDVGLDEFRPALEKGEAVDMLAAKGGTWKPACINGLTCSNPTVFGYIVEEADGGAPLSRMCPLKLRRRFTVGDEVDVYFGDREGWASCIVVDPATAASAKQLLSGDGGLEGVRLSANWRQNTGANAWTAVAVQRRDDVEGAAVVTVPSFLVKRAAMVDL